MQPCERFEMHQGRAIFLHLGAKVDEVRWGEGRRGEGGGVVFYFLDFDVPNLFPTCSLQVSLAFLTCSSDLQCIPQYVPYNIFFYPIYIFLFILIKKIRGVFEERGTSEMATVPWE